MKSKNIEKIRRACIESNPSILDLKDGCLIKGGGIIWNGGLYFDYDNMTDNIDVAEDEILGRDLQLADVLLVIEEILTKHGIYTKDAYLESFNSIIEKWDLKKPLHEQSDETILFIAGLLK